MKQVYRMDEEGFYIEPVVIPQGGEMPSDCVEIPPPSFYKARWQGGQWIETGEAPEAVQPIPTIEERMEKLQQDNEKLASNVAYLEDMIVILTMPF